MKVTSVRKSFGDMIVLDDLSMNLPKGRITAILGPSGCGKTTLLRVCAGLLAPDLAIDEQLSAIRRLRASFLFQETRLLSWETALQNVELVLSDILPQERHDRALRFLKLVGLQDYAEYYPRALSGGMKQRVSIARSFAYKSSILYMDEPFQGLDLELKLGLITTFFSLWQQDPRTVLFVTHDVLEAVLLGDEIVVLSPRPAKVRAELSNPVPPAERSLSHPETLALQGRLYELLLNRNTPPGDQQ